MPRDNAGAAAWPGTLCKIWSAWICSWYEPAISRRSHILSADVPNPVLLGLPHNLYRLATDLGALCGLSHTGHGAPQESPSLGMMTVIVGTGGGTARPAAASAGRGGVLASGGSRVHIDDLLDRESATAGRDPPTTVR
jgi:hypothetical protein